MLMKDKCILDNTNTFSKRKLMTRYVCICARSCVFDRNVDCPKSWEIYIIGVTRDERCKRTLFQGLSRKRKVIVWSHTYTLLILHIDFGTSNIHHNSNGNLLNVKLDHVIYQSHHGEDDMFYDSSKQKYFTDMIC